jgi:hypothetical protein
MVTVGSGTGQGRHAAAGAADIGGEYEISPSVLFTAQTLSGLLGYAGRVGDFSITETASRWFSQQAQQAPAIQLTQGQRAQIQAIRDSITNMDKNPRRPGSGFTTKEKGIGICVTQIVAPPFTHGLEIIFSRERAERILDSIVAMNDDDAEPE